jgi:deoxyribose-phosphate aldolase
LPVATEKNLIMSPRPASELAAKTDLAFWKPVVTPKEFAAFCASAQAKSARAICVNGSRVLLAAAGLEESSVQLVALVGFPLGTGDSDVKRYEAEVAIDFGAQEIELVLNLDHLKNGMHKALLREINDVVEAADERPVGVVLETRALTRAELVTLGGMLSDSGIKTVSTGTDFWPDARVDADDIKAILEALDPKIAIKAVGNLREASVAQELIAAGAARIGTAHLNLLGPA